MEQKLKRSEIIGCLFVWIAGTLLHFVYDWTNQNQIIGLISPVNESVWEHLKLLLFPTIVYSVFQYFYVGREYLNYFTAKLLGILSGMLVIVIGFYGSLAIFGKPITWIDIALFLIGVAVSFIVSYQFMVKRNVSEGVEILSFFILLLIIILFWAFTYYPPDFFLFKEVQNK